MRLRSVLVLLGTSLALGGCAAQTSSTTHASGAVPAAPMQAAVGKAPSAVRRTLSIPTCSGSGVDSFVGGGLSNVAHGTYAGVLTGYGNQACDNADVIGGGSTNAISANNDATEGFIGGGENNVITGNASYAVVTGGNGNIVNGGEWGVVAGGSGNTVTGNDATIAGGSDNETDAVNSLLGAGSGNYIGSGAQYGLIGGGSNNQLYARLGVIVGGLNNVVASNAEGGYIAAGGYNSLSGQGAVIDGGFNNTAAGIYATIPGGYVNSAAGTYSFAAGARASSAQTGTFVWSDGSDGDATLTSSREYQFLARASGGFTFWTNAASTVGATLAPGSGTWSSASDRNLKTDVARIDDAAVLDKVAALPVNRWSYKSERGVSHLGPMAQDFYAAFRVGEDDKHIASLDEDGVALAAIKALHAENARQSARIAALERDVAALRALVTRPQRPTGRDPAKPAFRAPAAAVR
ncbi:MAG TPA: tail fiber domain-containing protein [Candidatus Elarobacter sp.]|jgi:hypothetical protein|nr:tail fiber domain-containing protein [Candidatus Elarobacter sp.]